MWFIHAILLYARHCNHSLWNLGVIRKSCSDFICPLFYMVITFKLVISALLKWWLLIERKKFFWFLSYGIAFPIQQQKRQPGTVLIVIKLLSYGLKLLHTDVHIFSSLWGGLEPSHPSTTDCWAVVPSSVLLANKRTHLLFLMSTARNKV